MNPFFYTIPQWGVFAAIIAIVYGWVEKKKVFGMIGSALFVVLGIFALYAICAGYFVFDEFLSPGEIVGKELEPGNPELQELPLQIKLLPAYWGFVFAAVIAIPAFYFEWKEKKYAGLAKVLTGLVALGAFFIIVGAIRAD